MVPATTNSMERAWVVFYVVFAAVALARLRDGAGYWSPILIATGFLLFAVRQYLRIRVVPLNGRLYLDWQVRLVFAATFLVFSGLALRYVA